MHFTQITVKDCKNESLPPCLAQPTSNNGIRALDHPVIPEGGATAAHSSLWGWWLTMQRENCASFLVDVIITYWLEAIRKRITQGTFRYLKEIYWRRVTKDLYFLTLLRVVGGVGCFGGREVCVLPLWTQAAECNWWRRRVSLAKTVIRHHYVTVQQHNDWSPNAALQPLFSLPDVTLHFGGFIFSP